MVFRCLYGVGIGVIMVLKVKLSCVKRQLLVFCFLCPSLIGNRIIDFGRWVMFPNQEKFCAPASGAVNRQRSVGSVRGGELRVWCAAVS